MWCLTLMNTVEMMVFLINCKQCFINNEFFTNHCWNFSKLNITFWNEVVIYTSYVTFRLGGFTFSCVSAGCVWYLQNCWWHINLRHMRLYIHNGLSSSWWVDSSWQHSTVQFIIHVTFSHKVQKRSKQLFIVVLLPFLHT